MALRWQLVVAPPPPSYLPSRRAAYPSASYLTPKITTSIISLPPPPTTLASPTTTAAAVTSFGGDTLRRAKNTPTTSFRCLSALTPELRTTLDKVIRSQKVVLFMKGTKDFPQCGFSNTVVQILNSLNVPFETINILENDMLRQALKEYSSWPTFPQLYIDGDFFGGCDITVDAYQTGQLQELLEKTLCS